MTQSEELEQAKWHAWTLSKMIMINELKKRAKLLNIKDKKEEREYDVIIRTIFQLIEHLRQEEVDYGTYQGDLDKVLDEHIKEELEKGGWI